MQIGSSPIKQTIVNVIYHLRIKRKFAQKRDKSVPGPRVPAACHPRDAPGRVAPLSSTKRRAEKA